MDAKDQRIEGIVGEGVNNGIVNYTQAAFQSADKNKSYLDIGSSSSIKVGVRPCAVIGPDRIAPPQHVASDTKQASVEPWSYLDHGYHPPPQYPYKLPDYQHPSRNISPRQTFQENMPRIMVPRYNSNKESEDHNLTSEKNNTILKATKLHEAKYAEVPYSINHVTNEQKHQRSSETVSNVNQNLLRTATQGWASGAPGLRLPNAYTPPELYQYPDYAAPAPPRALPMTRPQRGTNEDPAHIYPDYYRGGNVRFEPYPAMKDRYPPPRYEYIPNFPSPYQTPLPHFATQKYDMQKLHPSVMQHPHYVSHPQATLMRDPVLESYQRHSKTQPNFNVPYHGPAVHAKYNPTPGNPLHNKLYQYPHSDPANYSAVPMKPQYDTNNKYFVKFDTTQAKHYTPDSYGLNEFQRNHHLKNQAMIPNYPVNMHNLPYYRKDNMLAKNVDYYGQYKAEPFHNHLQSRKPPQFSPSMISPSDSVASEMSHILYGNQDDCGYASLSSAAARSMDSNMYKMFDSRYRQIIGTQPASRVEMNSRNLENADKKNLDVRQFLQSWNEEDDENGDKTNCKEIVESSSELRKHCEVVNNPEQLYVLGLVNVPSNELAKYEHIQKVSKLPENIKGYTSIELLNQFEEAIESSNMSCYEKKILNQKEPKVSMNPTSNKPIGIPNRPVSPLDVESKISQSVIHKEVGCNFEIRPCSPKMLNVQAAAPAHSLLRERNIEKVTNPVIKNLVQNLEDKPINNCDVIKRGSQRTKENDDELSAPSCKMIKTQYKESMDLVEPVKTSYSVQDLESNSGVCLASLPRLDNDIELNFPEVNQQFINANKTDSRNTEKVAILISPSKNNDILLNESNTPKSDHLISLVNEKINSTADLESIQATKFHPVRINSVIMKNPETDINEKCKPKHLKNKTALGISPKTHTTSKSMLTTNAIEPLSTPVNSSKESELEKECEINEKEIPDCVQDNTSEINDLAENTILQTRFENRLSPSNASNNIKNEVNANLTSNLTSNNSESEYAKDAQSELKEASDKLEERDTLKESNLKEKAVTQNEDVLHQNLLSKQTNCVEEVANNLNVKTNVNVSSREDEEEDDDHIDLKKKENKEDDAHVSNVMVSEDNVVEQSGFDAAQFINTNMDIVSGGQDTNDIATVSVVNECTLSKSEENITSLKQETTLANKENDVFSNYTDTFQEIEGVRDNKIDFNFSDSNSPSFKMFKTHGKNKYVNVAFDMESDPLFKSDVSCESAQSVKSPINEMAAPEPSIVYNAKNYEHNAFGSKSVDHCIAIDTQSVVDKSIDQKLEITDTIKTDTGVNNTSEEKYLNDTESNDNIGDMESDVKEPVHTPKSIENNNDADMSNQISINECCENYTNMNNISDRESDVQEPGHAPKHIEINNDSDISNQIRFNECCENDRNLEKIDQENTTNITDRVTDVKDSVHTPKSIETKNDSDMSNQNSLKKYCDNEKNSEESDQENTDNVSNLESDVKRPVHTPKSIENNKDSDLSNLIILNDCCEIDTNFKESDLENTNKFNDREANVKELVHTTKSIETNNDFDISIQTRLNKYCDNDTNLEESDQENTDNVSNLESYVKRPVHTPKSIENNKDADMANQISLNKCCENYTNLEESDQEYTNNISDQVSDVKEPVHTPKSIETKNDSDMSNQNSLNKYCDNDTNFEEINQENTTNISDRESNIKERVYTPKIIETNGGNKTDCALNSGSVYLEPSNEVNAKTQHDSTEASYKVENVIRLTNKLKTSIALKKEFFSSRFQKLLFLQEGLCTKSMQPQINLEDHTLLLETTNRKDCIDHIKVNKHTETKVTINEISEVVVQDIEVKNTSHVTMMSSKITDSVKKIDPQDNMHLQCNEFDLTSSHELSPKKGVQASNVDQCSLEHEELKKMGFSAKCKRQPLKRSFSESALDKLSGKDHQYVNYLDTENKDSLWPNKRKKDCKDETSTASNNSEAYNFCNFIPINRRYSISSPYEGNVSFCILIDDNCIIAEEQEEVCEKEVCYTGIVQDSFESNNCEESVFEELTAHETPIVLTPTNIESPPAVSFPFEYQVETNNVDSWVDDVACVETVVSDEIDDEDTKNTTNYVFESSPILHLDDSQNNEEHTRRIKQLYGDEICSNDIDLIKTLYTTPQMDLNRTLHDRESQMVDNECKYENDRLDQILSGYEENDFTENDKENYLVQPVAGDIAIDMQAENTDILTLGIEQVPMSILSIDKPQDETVHSRDLDNDADTPDIIHSTSEPVFKRSNSSPEVSSTTVEDKKSGILLKIRKYGGSITSHINNTDSENKKIRCKLTEESGYLCTKNEPISSKPLLTKAAQKYIPPINETNSDLKVQLRLPEQSLTKLKLLKLSKVGPKINSNKLKNYSYCNNIRSSAIKKPKPRFEDVLKNIDEVQKKMHKEKSKKSKKSIPKMIIKKTGNGSHYTSSHSFNPDLTGRKWQPWVFIEKNSFIEKMLQRGKRRAIYCHRKKSYIFFDKFRKYKAVCASSPSFTISSPSSDHVSGPLKYTIRLKRDLES